MLLIGSAAARRHWADFREPTDVDLLAHYNEIPLLYEALGEPISIKGDKYKFHHWDGLTIEVEAVHFQENSSWKLLDYAERSNLPTFDWIKTRKWAAPSFDIKPYVASPSMLLAIKRSHIPFNIHWRKNFKDYSFISSRVNFDALSQELKDIHDLRFKETRNRTRGLDFDMSNEDFFNDNVKRKFDHDSIHRALSAPDEPAFLKCKEDPTQANVKLELFNNLSLEEKLQFHAEEVMALSLERVLIPARLRHAHINRELHNKAVILFLSRVCNHFLPVEFRHWAIDHFYDILDSIPFDFVEKAFKNLGLER